MKGEVELVGGGESDVENQMSSREFGATGGLGFNYQITEGNFITFDARYGFGLQMYETGDNKNRVSDMWFTFPIGSAE